MKSDILVLQQVEKLTANNHNYITIGKIGN